MQMSFDIHPKIEVGTTAGTLRASGEELTCRIGDLFLTARLVGDRFVFSGGGFSTERLEIALHGEHSLDARSQNTSADRLIAHWRGYCENNERCHLETGGSL
jgi:hypothetical protein